MKLNNFVIEETELINELDVGGVKIKVNEIELDCGESKIEVQLKSENKYFDDVECAYDYIDENTSITIKDKMSNLFDVIEKEFYADGETAPNTNDIQYATIFYSKEEFLDTWEDANEKFEVDVDELSYPVIVFDTVNSTGGEVHTYKKYFSYGYNVELIMNDARDYFNKR